MLKLRVITALALLAVLVPALLASATWPFLVVSLVLVVAAAWEWGRLNGAGGWGSWLLAGLVLVLALAAWQAGWEESAPVALWWLAAALWLVGGGYVLRGGPPAWAGMPRGLRWAVGVLVLGVAWLALGRSRHIGINFVLSVMALVWAADIAAYFGGKAWGRRKLAPHLSPGKTWEGAVSGAVAVLVLAGLWQILERSLSVDSLSVFGRLFQHWGLVPGGLAIVLLTAMSVVGDLFESGVKRAVGAKDSSGLLPGHGGVLDRIDALLPVFPCALALTVA